MLQQRRNEIIEWIRRDRIVKVPDLMNEFGVSIETIRRDLEYLEKHGFLKRVYGGAVLIGLYGEEPTYGYREVINLEQKKAIGAKTAELVNDGDALILDLGTTMLEVARCLVGKQNLTVITNATVIAQIMTQNDTCRVIMLGGMLRPGELSVSGFLTDECLKPFHANKLILGVGGITPDNGVTDYHVDETNNRRTMLTLADRVIAVADYSKFGVTAMNRVCSIKQLHTLVTDWTTAPNVVAEYRSSELNVVIAPPLD